MKNPYTDTYKWVLAHADDQICSCFHLFVQLITPEPCIWLMSSHLHLQVWTAHPQHAKQTQNKQILTSQRLSNGILLLICCHGAALWKGGRKDKHQSPFPHLWWLLLFGGEGGGYNSTAELALHLCVSRLWDLGLCFTLPTLRIAFSVTLTSLTSHNLLFSSTAPQKW